MKFLYFVLVLLVLLKSCFPQEAPQQLIGDQSTQSADGSNSYFYVGIDNARFHLRYSHRSDVETLLGIAPKSTFFERGGEGFYWRNFTVLAYDDEHIRFHHNEEGYVIRITINSNTSHRITLPFGSLETLDFNAIEAIARQGNPKDTHIFERSISFGKGDANGDEFSLSFWFDDDFRITWVNVMYDRPWNNNETVMLHDRTINVDRYSGLANSDGIRIRVYPSLEAEIIGRLDRGTTVAVYGRSRYRMFLDGFDSFWLKINAESVEGWAYGAFINLLDSQHERLPVLSEARQIGIVDLNYHNHQNMPDREFLQRERELLILQSGRFMDASIQEFYDTIVKAFNHQQSLRPFFLNTIEIGLSETGNFFHLPSSYLSDFIQSSYADNITIWPLTILSEYSGAFIIDGFKEMPTFFGIPIGSITVNIKRIENTNFTPLNGKAIIDRLVFNGKTAEEWLELSWGDAERFNSVLTDIPLFLQHSVLLEMILND